MPDLVVPTPSGLYCEIGDFHIDAYGKADRNIVTHAHSDHARFGSNRYLCSSEGEAILRTRLGESVTIEPVPYGQSFEMNGVKISLHPAGHVRGSAQVRMEHKGHVTVVTGDYKRAEDSTCSPFEVVRCNTFITESTFGLPIYTWKPSVQILAEVNAWWRSNVAIGRTSIIYAYSLGKAQRVLSGLDESIGPILLHGAMVKMVETYRAAGVKLPPAEHATVERVKELKAAGQRAIVLAPGSAAASTWLRKFLPYSTGSASGWMAVRGAKRRKSIDHGFVLSDHVDWPGLLTTIKETGATRIGVTHGYVNAVTRYLNETGLDAFVIPTHFEGDGAEEYSDATEGVSSPA